MKQDCRMDDLIAHYDKRGIGEKLRIDDMKLRKRDKGKIQ
jgi:hypothetical protein